MDGIYVMDAGGGQAMRIVRKIRAEGFYADTRPMNAVFADVQMRGIVIAGGEKDSDALGEACDAACAADVPVLAVGVSAWTMTRRLGGAVSGEVLTNETSAVSFGAGRLFRNVEPGERYFVRMAALCLPDGARENAVAQGVTAAYEIPNRDIYAMQFAIDVNDPDGLAILRNFTVDICGCAADWNTADRIARAVSAVSALPETAPVLTAVSGGLRAAVAAAIAVRAAGARAGCVYVDTGLMRADDAGFAGRICAALGVPMETVDVSARMETALTGVTSDADKRQIAEGVLAETLINAAAFRGDARIVTGAALSTPQFPQIVPLSGMDRTEICEMAQTLMLPDDVPGRVALMPAGLALRVQGKVTPRRISAVRTADSAFRDQLLRAGLEKKVVRAEVYLAETDNGQAMVLRASGVTEAAVRIPHDVLESVSARIFETEGMVTSVLHELARR